MCVWFGGGGGVPEKDLHANLFFRGPEGHVAGGVSREEVCSMEFVKAVEVLPMVEALHV